MEDLEIREKLKKNHNSSLVKQERFFSELLKSVKSMDRSTLSNFQNKIASYLDTTLFETLNFIEESRKLELYYPTVKSLDKVWQEDKNFLKEIKPYVCSMYSFLLQDDIEINKTTLKIFKTQLKSIASHIRRGTSYAHTFTLRHQSMLQDIFDSNKTSVQHLCLLKKSASISEAEKFERNSEKRLKNTENMLLSASSEELADKIVKLFDEHMEDIDYWNKVAEMYFNIFETSDYPYTNFCYKMFKYLSNFSQEVLNIYNDNFYGMLESVDKSLHSKRPVSMRPALQKLIDLKKFSNEASTVELYARELFKLSENQDYEDVDQDSRNIYKAKIIDCFDKMQNVVDCSTFSERYKKMTNQFLNPFESNVFILQRLDPTNNDKK